MAISEAVFGRAVSRMRPRLIQAARRLRRRGADDAEDLVSDALFVALTRLDEVDAETGLPGLMRWLIRIMHFLARREQRNDAASVLSLPLSDALTVTVNGDTDCPWRLRNTLSILPHHERLLVMDWMDGHTQRALAQRHRMHRTTVNLRLKSAFATLRAAYADAGALEEAFALFAAGSRVTVYRKPQGVWLPWQQQHPPERPFRPAAGAAGANLREPQ